MLTYHIILSAVMGQTFFRRCHAGHDFRREMSGPSWERNAIALDAFAVDAVGHAY